MMSIILLLPVEISTDRSTDQPCALDMCNTVRSFTNWSNTCVIRRLAFLNLDFIGQISPRSLPPSVDSLASQNSGLSTNLKILRYLNPFCLGAIFRRAAQGWNNRTLISHEPLVYSKTCFSKTEPVQ